jgi:hypothetical protein
MQSDIPSILVALCQAYLVVGLIVAVLFLVLGIEAIDPGAEGSYVFRVLLLPGLVALWPLVILRWAQVMQPLEPKSVRSHMQRHATTWMVLTMLIPFILVAAAMERRASLPNPSSERLSADRVQP